MERKTERQTHAETDAAGRRELFSQEPSLEMVPFLLNVPWHFQLISAAFETLIRINEADARHVCGCFFFRFVFLMVCK